jgi:hypothetical protein
VVKLGCIPAIFAFGNLVYLITSISKPHQSTVYFRPQLCGDLKFAFYRYSLHSCLSKTHPIISEDDFVMLQVFKKSSRQLKLLVSPFLSARCRNLRPAFQGASRALKRHGFPAPGGF